MNKTVRKMALHLGTGLSLGGSVVVSSTLHAKPDHIINLLRQEGTAAIVTGLGTIAIGTLAAYLMRED